MIIDRNRLCYDGDTEDVMALEDLEAKLRAFNWKAGRCNGHDVHDLLRALTEERPDMPYAVIAETVKGKGVSFMENNAGWHGKAPNDEEYATAMADLEKIGAELGGAN